MTALEFQSECASRLIEPGVALESEDVVRALRARDDKALIEALDNLF